MTTVRVVPGCHGFIDVFPLVLCCLSIPMGCHDPVPRNVFSYSAAISACENASEWQQAFALFETMQQAQATPNAVVFNALISACKSQWQLAIHWLQEMPDALHDVITYTTSISSCEKGGQWQHALFLFHQMPRAQLQPNQITYNATISACEKGRQSQQAMKLFEAMPTSRVQPDVITYNALISASEGGQWDHALHIFAKMHEAQLQHDVISYSAAISVAEKGKQWQLALLFFRTMLRVPGWWFGRFLFFHSVGNNHPN